MKKFMKIIPNNDVNLDINDKPQLNEESVADKSSKIVKWVRKRPGDEQPAIRDIFEPDQLKDALKTEFIDKISVTCSDTNTR